MYWAKAIVFLCLVQHRSRCSTSNITCRQWKRAKFIALLVAVLQEQDTKNCQKVTVCQACLRSSFWQYHSYSPFLSNHKHCSCPCVDYLVPMVVCLIVLEVKECRTITMSVHWKSPRLFSVKGFRHLTRCLAISKSHCVHVTHINMVDSKAVFTSQGQFSNSVKQSRCNSGWSNFCGH